MLRKRAGGVNGGNIAVTDQLAKKKLKEKNGKTSMSVILTEHLYFLRFPIWFLKLLVPDRVKIFVQQSMLWSGEILTFALSGGKRATRMYLKD